MKIRSGFVSNSSSSSFLLIGDPINLSDIKSFNDDYVAIGKDMYEGADLIYIDDYFKLTMLKESGYDFKAFKVDKSEFEPNIANILDMVDEDTWDLDCEQIEELLNKKFKSNCAYLYIDYCTTDEDFDEFCSQYGLELSREEIEKKTQIYLRELKLNRILDEKISKI